jgi:hypothetical protein
MSKFVKLSAGLLEPKPFTFPWFAKNAFRLFGKKPAVLSKMGFKKGVAEQTFVAKFMDLIQDNDFQDVIFAALISMRDLEGNPLLKDANGNPLDIKPEEMFKDINYYYQTQGSQISGKPSGSIAAGAYQSILFPQPRKEILPKDNVVESTIEKLKSLTSSPDFNKKTPEQKRQLLLGLTKQIIGENKPLINFIDSNKILP